MSNTRGNPGSSLIGASVGSGLSFCAKADAGNSRSASNERVMGCLRMWARDMIPRSGNENTHLPAQIQRAWAVRFSLALETGGRERRHLGTQSAGLLDWQHGGLWYDGRISSQEPIMGLFDFLRGKSSSGSPGDLLSRLQLAVAEK